MGRRAGLDANQAGSLLLEEGQNTHALELLTGNNFAFGINAVNLENRLRNVEADGRDRLHLLLLRMVITYRQPTSWRSRAGGRSRPQHQVLTTLPRQREACGPSGLWLG